MYSGGVARRATACVPADRGPHMWGHSVSAGRLRCRSSSSAVLSVTAQALVLAARGSAARAAARAVSVPGCQARTGAGLDSGGLTAHAGHNGGRSAGASIQLEEVAMCTDARPRRSLVMKPDAECRPAQDDRFYSVTWSYNATSQGKRLWAVFRASKFRRQRALARAARVSEAHLSLWLNGHAAIPVKPAMRLASALGVTPGYLLFGETNSHERSRP